MPFMDSPLLPTHPADERQPGDQAPPLRPGAGLATWLLAGAVVVSFAIDQLSKQLAIDALLSGSIDVGFIRLHLVANRGILMGLPAPTVVIVLATLLVVGMAVRTARHGGGGTAIAYGMIVGGALGNLLDRFVSRQFFPPNAVVDWISYGDVTFNLADVFLVAGIAVLFFGSSSHSPSRDRAETAGSDRNK